MLFQKSNCNPLNTVIRIIRIKTRIIRRRELNKSPLTGFQHYHINVSYVIINCIREFIPDNIPEKDMLSYDVDTAEMIYNRTDGFNPKKIQAFIASQRAYYKLISALKDYQPKKKTY